MRPIDYLRCFAGITTPGMAALSEPAVAASSQHLCAR